MSVKATNKSISGNIVVPETVTYNAITYTVTHIPTYAFDQSDISEISLPSSIINLSGYAFNECIKLKIVTFYPSYNPITFASGIFSGCIKLKKIILPSKLQNLGAYTFKECDSLKTITIPSTVQDISSSTKSARVPNSGLMAQ